MVKAKGKAGQIRASHILVEKNDKAQNILDLLKKGEKFEELAKKFSTCPSRKKGGDLGFFSKGQMVSEFDQVVFRLKIDQLHKIAVKTKFGYHIIKRTG